MTYATHYPILASDEDHIYEISSRIPLEDEWEADECLREFQGNVPPGFWRTTSGEIEISKMTDEHLRNAVAWAERERIGEGSGKLAELQVELEKRGIQ